MFVGDIVRGKRVLSGAILIGVIGNPDTNGQYMGYLTYQFGAQNKIVPVSNIQAMRYWKSVPILGLKEESGKLVGSNGILTRYPVYDQNIKLISTRDSKKSITIIKLDRDNDSVVCIDESCNVITDSITKISNLLMAGHIGVTNAKLIQNGDSSTIGAISREDSEEYKRDYKKEAQVKGKLPVIYLKKVKKQLVEVGPNEGGLKTIINCTAEQLVHNGVLDIPKDIDLVIWQALFKTDTAYRVVRKIKINAKVKTMNYTDSILLKNKQGLTFDALRKSSIANIEELEVYSDEKLCAINNFELLNYKDDEQGTIASAAKDGFTLELKISGAISSIADSFNNPNVTEYTYITIHPIFNTHNTLKSIGNSFAKSVICDEVAFPEELVYVHMSFNMSKIGRLILNSNLIILNCSQSDGKISWYYYEVLEVDFSKATQLKEVVNLKFSEAIGLSECTKLTRIKINITESNKVNTNNGPNYVVDKVVRQLSSSIENANINYGYRMAMGIPTFVALVNNTNLKVLNRQTLYTTSDTAFKISGNLDIDIRMHGDNQGNIQINATDLKRKIKIDNDAPETSDVNLKYVSNDGQMIGELAVHGAKEVIFENIKSIQTSQISIHNVGLLDISCITKIIGSKSDILVCRQISEIKFNEELETIPHAFINEWNGYSIKLPDALLRIEDENLFRSVKLHVVYMPDTIKEIYPQVLAKCAKGLKVYTGKNMSHIIQLDLIKKGAKIIEIDSYDDIPDADAYALGVKQINNRDVAKIRMLGLTERYGEDVEKAEYVPFISTIIKVDKAITEEKNPVYTGFKFKPMFYKAQETFKGTQSRMGIKKYGENTLNSIFVNIVNLIVYSTEPTECLLKNDCALFTTLTQKKLIKSRKVIYDNNGQTITQYELHQWYDDSKSRYSQIESDIIIVRVDEYVIYSGYLGKDNKPSQLRQRLEDIANTKLPSTSITDTLHEGDILGEKYSKAMDASILCGVRVPNKLSESAMNTLLLECILIDSNGGQTNESRNGGNITARGIMYSIFTGKSYEFIGITKDSPKNKSYGSDVQWVKIGKQIPNGLESIEKFLKVKEYSKITMGILARYDKTKKQELIEKVRLTAVYKNPENEILRPWKTAASLDKFNIKSIKDFKNAAQATYAFTYSILTEGAIVKNFTKGRKKAISLLNIIPLANGEDSVVVIKVIKTTNESNRSSDGYIYVPMETTNPFVDVDFYEQYEAFWSIYGPNELLSQMKSLYSTYFTPNETTLLNYFEAVEENRLRLIGIIDCGIINQTANSNQLNFLSTSSNSIPKDILTSSSILECYLALDLYTGLGCIAVKSFNCTFIAFHIMQDAFYGIREYLKQGFVTSIKHLNNKYLLDSHSCNLVRKTRDVSFPRWKENREDWASAAVFGVIFHHGLIKECDKYDNVNRELYEALINNYPPNFILGNSSLNKMHKDIIIINRAGE